MSRTLLVQSNPNFKIEIPDEAKVTFAPFSPPRADTRGNIYGYNPVGTLRIYEGNEKNLIGVFIGVEGFRDITKIGYAEEVAVEEGATIWKSDKNGYERSDKVTHVSEFVPDIAALPAPKPRRRRKQASA